MFTFLFGTGLLTLLLSSQGSSIAPTSAQNDNFTPSECGFYVPVGMPVKCGYLTVPADRANPDGETMRLHVSYFQSFSETPVDDPIVYVMGGVGGGPGSDESIALYQGVDVDFAIFLEHRDFIVLDQRGMGYSEPNLNCRAYEQAIIANAQAAQTPNTIYQSLESALQDCFATFNAEGIDLRHFSTENTTADLEDLRAALGIESWNLYAVGYGAQPALNYARDYPEHTRSIILSSPITDLPTWLQSEVSRVEASLQTLYTSCAQSEECNTDFPQVSTAFEEAIALLAENPVTIEIAHPIVGVPMDFVIDDDQFIETVKWSLLFAENILFLPFIIETTAVGSYRFLAILASQLVNIAQFTNEGTHYALLCQEAIPYINDVGDETTLNAIAVEHLKINLKLAQSICQTLNLPPHARFEVPNITKIPLLVFRGEYEHVSLESDIEAILAMNPNAQTFTFPNLTYDVLYSWDICPQLVTADFLEAPQQTINTPCLQAIEPTDFMSIADMLQLQGSYTAE